MQVARGTAVEVNAPGGPANSCVPQHRRNPRIQGDQQVKAFLLAHLTDHDALRPHSQRFMDQMAQADLAGAFQVGLPRLQPHDVRQRNLQPFT
jgi:hypothetical protein